MKSCPFCAEEIQDAAIKCKHCGEMLTGQPPATHAVAPAPAYVESPVAASGGNSLRPLGSLLIFGGLAIALYGLSMDTSVAVPTQEFMGQTIGGGRVNNIGLMQDRQNLLMIGGVGFIGGLILRVASGGQAPAPSSSPATGKPGPLPPVEVTPKMRKSAATIGAILFAAITWVVFLIAGFKEGQAMFMGVIGAILGGALGWQFTPALAAMEAANPSGLRKG